MYTFQELLLYTEPSPVCATASETFQAHQWGRMIKPLLHESELEDVDLVLIGCDEYRGQYSRAQFHAPERLREEFFALYNWHPDIKIGDLGNVRHGITLADTRAALKLLLAAMHAYGKRVLILGGSHDLTIQQYEVFRDREEIIDFSVIDMLADLGEGEVEDYSNYLLSVLTSVPNFVHHFNLIGFQSYYVQPEVIQTLDNLRFDCLRLGKAREDLEQVEPMLRHSHLLSLDIHAVRHSDAPSGPHPSPNGFYGEEICKLTRFAGMSEKLCSFGIYGYHPETDEKKLTARLIAQMIWYYIDGLHIAMKEAPMQERDHFLEYQITFTDQYYVFLKSKRSNRWWMKLTDGRLIPCSHKDYLTACNNEMPERWLREMERMV